ncbi:uncharacterized protein EDB91DRAFT_1249285 [Suillus paluster]|uniref:uncharacterized protein n=1 Tax=Suillus paluster TaxID=48578 RepID=UPI001B862403|nr:uncharacterized protein EDB91DRAFT_1249285 [Suillus paluster]KAG1738368.1 hypothetical protein EDB91DRAFT_1249285 [Suillus paluster]
MPSVVSFDGFRLRWRSKSFAKPLPPSENDSDRSSSPQQVENRISFHITTPKSTRQSADRPRNVQHNEKTLPGLPTGTSSKQFHDEVVNEKSSTHYLEQPMEVTPDQVVGLLTSTTNIHKSLLPPPPDRKTSLIRRVTSKLHIIVPATASPSQPKSSVRPAHAAVNVKHSPRPPRSPRIALPRSPTLPNSFVSREHREAALRERGLLPPRKDLSEQEREADKRLGLTPLPDQHENGSSAASKIKEEWLSINRSSESRASDSGSAFHPRQIPNFSALASGVALISHSASPSLPRTSTCDSDCSRADLNAEIPFLARSSISSSVPPLSQSSHLEALQEEPAEHVPPTSPPPHHVQPPIIISTPVEDSFPPGFDVLVESPISCTFSTHLAPPGSSSQPHTPLPVSPDKENSSSPFSAHQSRRRTTDSNDRRRSSSVGTSLSRFGTNSLTNLRRSVIGSIRYSGSSANLSTASSQLSSPRVAVSPTMHNRGSILVEARGIQDAESRRLSELAFLD